MSDAWIDEARAVADGKRELPRGWALLRGERPPVLEGDGVRALVAPMVAAVAWSGAVFREMVGGAPLDPLALLMRVIALGLTLRALVLLAGLARRLVIWSRAGEARLVLSDEGLFARLPDGERAMARGEIVGVVEPGHWSGRSSVRRWAPVYVVGSSVDQLFVALPPIFDATAGVLAERLQRWLGVVPEPEEPTFPEPPRLPSKVYDDAAAGVRDPGTLVFHHGGAWMRRGPYAVLLVALAIADGLLRGGAPDLALGVPITAGMLALAALFLAALVPATWLLMTRRSIAPRRGLAMVLTEAELLMRLRSGVLRVAWPKLRRATVETQSAWSMLDGVHRAKSLVLTRRDGPNITYAEAFLGLPVEVAWLLVDAYRRAVLPPRAIASSEPAIEQPPTSEA